MRAFVEDEQLDYEDVLLQPAPYTNIKSRSEVCLTKRYTNIHGAEIARGIPIMNANMSTVGNFAVAKAMLNDGMFTTIHKHYHPEEIVEFMKTLQEEEAARVFITIGLRDKFMTYDKLMGIRTQLIQAGYHPGQVCIDVPNAYMTDVHELIKLTSTNCPSTIVMAGNVCTFEGAQRLCQAGARVVKVGISPGSACRTRFATGVGRPQLSAIIDCVEGVKNYGAKVCADGGIVYPGDVAKAFAAGAEFVMLGGFYAGTEEAEGPYLHDPATGERVKIFYGMASKTAQDLFYGGVADYKTSEGSLIKVNASGTVHDKNLEIMGGLRSACTYLDAINLEELEANAVFYKVRRQHTIAHGGNN